MIEVGIFVADAEFGENKLYSTQAMYKMTVDLMMVMMMLSLGKTDSLNLHKTQNTSTQV